MKTLAIISCCEAAMIGVVSASTVSLVGDGDYTSIAEAVSFAYKGDTVLIKPGIYNETNTISIKDSITLQGCGPQFTKIYSLSNNAISIDSNIAGVTIQGITITGGVGINIGYNNSSSIRNCVIAGCSYGIYHTWYSGDTYRGKGSTLSLVNCTISDNLHKGLVFRMWTDYYGAYGTLNVYNTIFAFNAEGNFDVNCGSSSYYNCDSFNGSWANVSYSSGCILGDPLFVNRNEGNYLLSVKPKSQCIDSGMVTYLDPDGSRVDMGAYGGMQTAGYWPYPMNGPVITDFTVNPGIVSQGGKISIRAVGIIR